MPKAKSLIRIKRAPLSPQKYMDRLLTVWRLALTLNDQDTTTMVKRRLTGGFMVSMDENRLDFGDLPTVSDDQTAIRPRFVQKLESLEKKFNQMHRQVILARQAPSQINREQSAAAK